MSEHWIITVVIGKDQIPVKCWELTLVGWFRVNESIGLFKERSR